MKKLLLILLCLPILAFSDDRSKLALVIGNSNYDEAPLNNPVNDALLMKKTLEYLDFDVILDTNITDKNSFINTIREFGNRRKDYSVALVYYAGHGIQFESENYLLPTKGKYETKDDVYYNGVNVQEIMRFLKSMTNNINILILDACRNNPFEKKWDQNRSIKGSGLAKMPAPTGSLIAFSTDAGMTAADGNGKNSIYCESLCKNMLRENLVLEQVFKNVRKEVLDSTNSRQIPVENTKLTGDPFYFNYKQLITSKSNCFEDFKFATDTTLDIITWNLNWFPNKGDSTIVKLIEIINGINADIIAFQEITSDIFLQKLADKLPQYSAIMNKESTLNLGFLYKDDLEELELFPLPAKDALRLRYLFSRLPLILKFKYRSEYISIFNMHHKCCGDGILDLNDPSDEETRRYMANKYMANFFTNGKNKNGIILGDFNDQLSDDISMNTFSPYTRDKENFLITDFDYINKDVSNWSYPSWPSHLDYIIINKNLFDNFKLASNYVQTLKINECFDSFNEYTAVISDHLPVGIRLHFKNKITKSGVFKF